MNMTTSTGAGAGVLSALAAGSGQRGLDIGVSAALLRRYAFIEQGLMRMLAGWFLAAPAYETKYALASHLLDHADHVGWWRERLREMRGGQINASVGPALARCLAETVHAPDVETFVAGAYGEVQAALLRCCRDHRSAADPVANAVEVRILDRVIPEIERHVSWADGQASGADRPPGVAGHRAWVRRLLADAGGISGLETVPAGPAAERPAAWARFDRPQTIHLDGRVARGELTRYETREVADAVETAREDFKVFFNELYAAALLASILSDSEPADVPWEFLHDVARQCWDEARHSEFGAVRLRELGFAPDVYNPVLFEQTQDLPILHRFCYLTQGLETYFMPRKRPRVAKYAGLGDSRSQLFADQDWSDETLHVRFGKRWVAHFLEGDFRTSEDILAEVRVHLEAASGQRQEAIAAPF